MRQSGIIQKSAVDEMWEYIEEIIDTIKSCNVYHMTNAYKLRQLITAARKEEAERAGRKKDDE